MLFRLYILSHMFQMVHMNKKPEVSYKFLNLKILYHKQPLQMVLIYYVSEC